MKHDETHGWAWDAIGFEDRDVLLENIQKSVQNGSLVENMIVDNNGRKVFYLVYPNNNPVQICLLIKSDENENMLESFYPVVEGIENEITILEKHRWENNLEGEVIADFNDAVAISFFAPFFCKEFDNIKHKKTKVFLAGIADNIEIEDDEETTISEGPFYEVLLNEFLSENPGKTKDDFEPIKISMKGASVFLSTDYTSYFQFRGTVQAIETVSILDIEILKLKVCLVKPDDEDLNAYLYVSKNRVKYNELKIGCDIQGMVMLIGYIDYKISNLYTPDPDIFPFESYRVGVLDDNGEPKMFKHSAAKERIGKIMTPKELLAFGIEITTSILNESRKKSASINIENDKYSPDIVYENNDIQYYIKLLPFFPPAQDADISREDRLKFSCFASERNAVAIALPVNFFCMETFGISPLNGSTFAIKFNNPIFC
jgi:hypothetical protein